MQPGTAPQALDYTGSFSEDVYREKTPGRRRRFTLSGDRLIIQSRQFFGSEYEIPVLLRGVDPVYAVVRQRNPIASFGALILSGIFAILLVPAIFSPYSQMNWIGISVDAVISLICLATGLWNIRRIEYYAFGGNARRFDIARSGPDRDRFNEFVARLIARIHEAQLPAYIVSEKTTSYEVPLPPPSGVGPQSPSEPAKVEPEITPETTGSKD